MSGFERDQIIYEEGWRDNAPIGGDDPPADEIPPRQEPGKDGSKPLLITIQLIVCITAALVLFLLKAMDSRAYHSFMTWYRVEMSRPVISQEFFENAGPRLSTPDEVTVRESPDELPPR